MHSTTLSVCVRLTRFLLALLFLAVCASSASAADNGASLSLTLTARADGGAPVSVDGIACDNLRDTPEGQKDCLEIALPEGVDGAELAGALANPDGTNTDRRGCNNVGSVALQKGRLLYYPPDEFNVFQEPRGVNEVEGPAVRPIILTLRKRVNGEWQTLASKTIILARPPTILIHGVHALPECWMPFARDLAQMRGRKGQKLVLPLVTLDHYAPADYQGVRFNDRNHYPTGLFAGSGPVEIGADLLAQRIRQVLQQVRNGSALPFLESGNPDSVMQPFRYYAPDQTHGPALKLAIRRVDIVAWSYGGVIARWYLASSDKGTGSHSDWYHGGYAVPQANNRLLELCPRSPYRGDVRKLITLGSTWRGLPIANYINEVRFSRADDAEGLAAAPLRIPQWLPRSLWERSKVKRTVGSMVDVIETQMPLKTPATEVSAVNSPWMQALNYPGLNSGVEGEASPFREDVAYGSIAGDNSAYFAFGPLSSVSLYGALCYFQQPLRFPFLLFERRAGAAASLSPVIGAARDYSDGLVPLWSALIPGEIPGASQIVHVTHSSYFTDRATQSYTARWLNNRALPIGRLLKPFWNTTVASYEGRKRWTFAPGEMTPQNEAGIYVNASGIGRIAPAALQSTVCFQIVTRSDGSVSVAWNGPVKTARMRQVTLYEEAPEGVENSLGRPKKIRVYTEPCEAGGDCIVLEALQQGKTYCIVAEALVDNTPDPPILVKSGFLPIQSDNQNAIRR